MNRVETFPFKKGQRVKVFDKEDHKVVKGTVTSVDETNWNIWVQWDDLNDTVKHERDEFSTIRDINQ